jgi:hypothetical protein
MNILVSPTGIIMMNWIAPIYSECFQMNVLMEALGTEWGLSESMVLDVQNQLHLQTATWGLIWWEDYVHTRRAIELTYAQRRVIILAEILKRFSINRYRMETYLEMIQGVSNAVVHDYIGPYTFGVEILLDLSAPILTKNVIDLIERFKPAHMSYTIIYTPMITIGFNVAMSYTSSNQRLNRCGEIVCGTLPTVAQIRNN